MRPETSSSSFGGASTPLAGEARVRLVSDPDADSAGRPASRNSTQEPAQDLALDPSREAYRKTLERLYALEARRGMDFRLERLAPVVERLGHPQRAFACVHVTGTNGKGSTAAMVEAALRAGGCRTGLYSSPHLVSFRERIRTAGAPISREAVVQRVEAVVAAAEATGATLTFFEIATLAAFLHFREEGVEVAVVEAGLGGRLDATNVVDAEVAILTSVAVEHAEYLGGTVESIAFEKAGIVKPGAVVVTGDLPEAAARVVDARVREVGARRLAWGRDFGDFVPLAEARERGKGLAGAHQLRNAAVAAAAVEALVGVSPRAKGLDPSRPRRDAAIVGVRWPGRMEAIPRRSGRGIVLLDAAHNPAAIEALAASMDAALAASLDAALAASLDAALAAPLDAALAAPLDDASAASNVGAVAGDSRPRVLLFAAMADKDWASMLRTLAPRFETIILTALPMARAADPRLFLEIVPDATVESDPLAAFASADRAAGTHGSVVVTGSIFLLGHLYRAAGGTLLEQDLDDS